LYTHVLVEKLEGRDDGDEREDDRVGLDDNAPVEARVFGSFKGDFQPVFADRALPLRLELVVFVVRHGVWFSSALCDRRAQVIYGDKRSSDLIAPVNRSSGIPDGEVYPGRPLR